MTVSCSGVYWCGESVLGNVFLRPLTESLCVYLLAERSSVHSSSGAAGQGVWAVHQTAAAGSEPTRYGQHCTTHKYTFPRMKSIQAYLSAACKHLNNRCFSLHSMQVFFFCYVIKPVVNLSHVVNNRQKFASLAPRSCSCWQNGQRHSRPISGMKRWSDTSKTSSTG